MTVLPEQPKEVIQEIEVFYLYVLYFRNRMPLELLPIHLKYMKVCVYVQTYTYMYDIGNM